MTVLGLALVHRLRAESRSQRAQSLLAVWRSLNHRSENLDCELGIVRWREPGHPGSACFLLPACSGQHSDIVEAALVTEGCPDKFRIQLPSANLLVYVELARLGWIKMKSLHMDIELN